MLETSSNRVIEWKSLQRVSDVSISSLFPPNSRPAAASTGGTAVLVNVLGEQRSAVRASLKNLGCEIREYVRPAEALGAVLGGSVALVVLHEAGARDFCRSVRSSQPHQLLPLLVIGDKYDAALEVALLEAGADAYLSGSLEMNVLQARMRSCLRRKTLTDSMDDTESVLFTLAHSVEERDPALGRHCERLSLMAAATGVALGLSAEEIVSLQRGGFLHDIGKVAIPDDVLFKPGPLDPNEWEVMKSHPERGEKICRSVRSLAPVLPIIRSHHERWDGSGYPDKLKGREIPLLARILQLADIYDALTTERPYKQAFSPQQAVRMMEEEAAKGWRDPELTRIFLQLVPYFDQPDVFPLSAIPLNALASSIHRLRQAATGRQD